MRELELERYLLPGDTDEPLLAQSGFSEPLLLVSNQVRTRQSKRADILALDQAGCSVVIELKRHRGSMGVDTQALQYLAAFSTFKAKILSPGLRKSKACRRGSKGSWATISESRI